MMERTYLRVRGPAGEPRPAGERADRRPGAPVERVLEAGACGLKIHEDWGAYPEIVDATLALADAHDVAVCLHTDGLNESCELEDTVAAIAGRTIHAYHVEGVGGGHVPDLIGIVREPNVVCSSTTPTVPYGLATAAEHLEMILAVHGGSPDVPEDVEAARERIHPATMAAEGPLHELGAIQIVNSDSQGMGRIGETVRRTFQLAHAMKAWRATEAGAWPEAPTVRRWTRPGAERRPPRRQRARAPVPGQGHGRAGDRSTASTAEVGSLAPGRLADIVLWRPDALRRAAPSSSSRPAPSRGASLGQGNAAVEGVRARPLRRALGRHRDAPRRRSRPHSSRAAALEGGHPRAARQPASVRRGAGHPRHHARGTRREHAPRRPWRSIRGTERSRSTGGCSRRSRSREVPLSRRYLLA